MNKIADTARILKNVDLGKNVLIEDFVIIGAVPRRCKEGDLKTVIGDGALIRSHTVVYAGTIIGDNLQTGNHVSIREENRIGHNVSIGTKTVVEFKVTIGDNVRIHSQVFIPEYCELKQGCWIGPNVNLTNAKYPNSLRSKKFLQGVIVGQDAKIGANATVLSGIAIGANALVGAGSVVTRDVPQCKVVAGNPAEIIGDIKNLRYPTGENAYREE